mgnify:CR=1 FL=1
MLRNKGVVKMVENILKRNEVPVEETWDLTHLVSNEEAYEEGVKKLIKDTNEFNAKHKGNINNAQQVIEVIRDCEALVTSLIPYATYVSLQLEEDQTNNEAQIRASKFSTVSSQFASLVSFIDGEILELSSEELEKAIEIEPTYAHYLNRLIAKKAHQLHPEVEKTLAALSSTLDAPYGLYNTTKLVDMKFDHFTVGGKSYPLSYNLFEGDWELESDTEVRREAFKAFSTKLADYQHTTAKTYNTHVQTEKTLSDLRGYDSVTDYLLFDQEVEQDLYHRQIDLIMKELAPHMRRYAKLLQKEHGIGKMTFADLKIPMDPSYEPSVTIEESRDYMKKALGVMGEDYLAMIDAAFDERWIDFANNEGKSTGAFCSSPYGFHSYILISWTERMNEVFVLAHELGHAGHFRNAQKHQTLFNSDSSKYFVEAPSTLNEMLMANYLLKNSEDPRFKRWVISSIIARTYYHNFVTHLLEAAYQRKVYELIDAGESVNAAILSNITRSVLEEFWGNDVEINDGAELTWMRQPHYYMGLYPYTYSAGLTISTQVSKRILEEGQPAVEDWLKVLQAGGTKSPVELAKMANVDITTDKPLQETIAFIGSLIDQLEELTAEIHQTTN